MAFLRRSNPCARTNSNAVPLLVIAHSFRDLCSIGLSKELAGDAIRVNVVSPGLIDTEIHALSTGDATRVERLLPFIPMERAGSSDEIAEAVLFLISDQASYITGANLRVSGGR